MRLTPACFAAASVFHAGLVGCGGGGTSARTEGEEAGTSISATSPTSAGPDATGSGSATSTTDAPGTSGSPGTTGVADSSEASGDPPKFDVEGVLDTPAEPCGGGKGGGIDFSYIWVANSGQNAVSKIHTQTLIEEGRYLVHPGNGSPSRTSVSLSGDVAIASRCSSSR